MPVMMLNLPFPPSVNGYWRTVRIGKSNRTMISEKGRQYRTRVLESLGFAKSTFTGRLRLTVEMYPPDRRKRDLDNFLKASLDALTHAGIYQDDSQIDILIVKRMTVQKEGLLQVWIDEII